MYPEHVSKKEGHKCYIRRAQDNTWHVGASCAALGAGGMMLYWGQLALCHSDTATLLSEPQWLTPHGVILHLVAAASIHPHKHQGRFQQAPLGNAFQEVYIEKKPASPYKSFSVAAALRHPLHEISYIRSSSFLELYIHSHLYCLWNFHI